MSLADAVDVGPTIGGHPSSVPAREASGGGLGRGPVGGARRRCRNRCRNASDAPQHIQAPLDAPRPGWI
jgi:hypothetical protein